MLNDSHLSELIQSQAKKYGSKSVLTFRNFGSLKWQTVSWKQFGRRVNEVANAFLNLGLQPQENIAVFSQNCIQYLYTNFGAYSVRACTIPFYATCSEQQIQFMLNDADVRFLFVGEQEQYNKAHRVIPLCPKLERIIIFDHSVRISSHDPNALYFEDFIALGEGLPRQKEVEQRQKEVRDDDTIDILYTSGTTGESKGVVLSHGQYLAAIRANDRCVPVGESDRVIIFLPFTHIFERGWAYLCLAEGAQLIINTYPREIQDSMRQTKPTCMSAVPRFWEKVYTAVKDRMDNAPATSKKLFYDALETGRSYNIDYLSKGKRPPLKLALKYQLVNRTLLAMVRKQIGLDHPNIFPTAGATISPEVEEFVHSIGICMIAGYGLTESLATVSCDHKGKPYTIGSVGRPLDGVNVKIGENDEILLKGPTITPGYYRREAINKRAFDKDGFFHTGDAGYIQNGELFLKERIKDLFKTSNGKYIAPQMVESMVLADKYIDQVAVIADRRKFVSALIVPEFRMLEEYAQKQGIQYKDREELCRNKQVREMLMDRISTLQQPLAPYEQIKRITLLPHHFSMENGELTNTLKLKRYVVYENYKKEIDAMYEG